MNLWMLLWSMECCHSDPFLTIPQSIYLSLLLVLRKSSRSSRLILKFTVVECSSELSNRERGIHSSPFDLHFHCPATVRRPNRQFPPESVLPRSVSLIAS